MLLNKDVFLTDPRSRTIPNNGVTKVAQPTTPEQWNVLRYELQTFVCEGEYHDGLERILDTYLRNLGQPEQPAAWVSGFYGSGKSHLVRVLEYLWRDQAFPDGATARGLVHLPPEIKEHLRELSTASRREGGLWSAAGTLGAGGGDSVALALLAIVFRSMGLPESYPAARLSMWLRQHNVYDAVRQRIAANGSTFEYELRNMYVSPILAESILAAMPDVAADQRGVRDLLKLQYPQVTDLSDTELVATLDEALRSVSSDPAKLPCTLIVLDELQQYIGDNAARSMRVQQLVEACSSRLGSRLMIVATGQSALQSTPLLARIQGRFTVRVSLSDTDVVQVVRQVVLRKAPNHEPDLKAVLAACSGEIDRQLTGTKIEPTGADALALVADYPLLPVRRRFWERIFRAVDRAGVAGQLRNQLAVVHAATQAVADQPLGTVVPGDFIYTTLETSLQQSGVLLKDVAEIISRQRDGTDDGVLRSRLCALIFLIGQLPRDPGADIGVRATAEMLADLLVEDLTKGSAALRQRIPALLQGLVQSGSLMLVGSEYRIQTREGAEWTQEFQRRFNTISNDDARIADNRAAEIKMGVGRELQGLTLTHGTSKTPRKLDLFFTLDAPPANTGAVPVWVRDEWSAGESTVRHDAIAAGSDSPVVYVFLPRRRADDLKRALAGHAAATETLQTRQVATREGEEARAAMESQMRKYRADIDTQVAALIEAALVLQGGGTDAASGSLRDGVRAAAEASLARLYPQFRDGDHEKWENVVKRARQGSGDALDQLGYNGDADKHPATQQVLQFVGRVGKKGADVRKHFTGAPFGWPKDAVDASLMVLVAAGSLLATQNGVPVGVKQIDQGKLGTIDFRAEGAPIGLPQRLQIRNLLQKAGVGFKQNEEAQAIPDLVRALLDLARTAGGDAPKPAAPDTTDLRALQQLSGNEALGALFDLRDQLDANRVAWTQAKAGIEARMPQWERAQRLLAHAHGLPVAADVALQLEAIKHQRALLADPDPVTPLATKLTDALRAALSAAYAEHQRVYRDQQANGEATEAWQHLTPDQQHEVLQAHSLGEVAAPRVGTEADVLAELDRAPLATWANRTAALPERFRSAQLDAIRLLQPKAVRIALPSATLADEAAVDAYLAQVRELIMDQIAAGTPVVV